VRAATEAFCDDDGLTTLALRTRSHRRRGHDHKLHRQFVLIKGSSAARVRAPRPQNDRSVKRHREHGAGLWWSAH
jgi:hypothetical protein